MVVRKKTKKNWRKKYRHVRWWWQLQRERERRPLQFHDPPLPGKWTPAFENDKYQIFNDAICWYIDDDDDEKGGEMKSPWFEERLARPPPPFHLHSVITDKLTKYIFKDSFTFSLPLAFCTFKKKQIFDTHSRKHAGPGDIPRKILRKGNVSRNHTIYKISMISESFQSPKWMNFQRFLAFDPISEKCSKFMTKGVDICHWLKLTFQRIRKFVQFYDWAHLQLMCTRA